MPSRNSSMKASERTKPRAKEIAPASVCMASCWASFMRCLPSAQARAPLARVTVHASDVARIAPMRLSDAGKLALTLTRLEAVREHGRRPHRGRESAVSGGRQQAPNKKRAA
ncbi:hypothetical protein BOSEA31B_13658 [Hyphomicrobiales bacterium]|nr:hypothetical protein BOSEA31B_13658 [Hyphomicrobiales bacterium]CAH1699429.1 hypothetical protein BOSEA1005_12482 [Hyphomicrobiales bacterium]CAI0343217.1 hypothetical protein BO1005MUT1_220016 [Hyphomicrobiales bacterium]